MPRFYTTAQISEHMHKTPEGYLLCENVPITRTGEFLYKESELLDDEGTPLVQGSPDGLVRIIRDADEVFSEDTINSFNGKSFTIGHPGEFVTPESWASYTHGLIQNVHRGINENSDLMLCDLVVTTEEGINRVEAGERELSCGYDAQYSQIAPGIGRQYKIIGNHVALVPKGRAGGRCSIVDADLACAGCGKCTCGKNKTQDQDIKNQQEVEMAKETKGVLANQIEKIRLWLDAFPSKDEDDDPDPDKKKDEKDTKDEGGGETDKKDEKEEKKEEKKEDKKDTKDESDPDKKDEDKKDEKKDEDKKDTKDEGGMIENRLAALEDGLANVVKMLQDLLAIETEEDEKETKDEGEKDKKEDEKDTKDEDKKDEEKEDEKKEMKDAWPDALSHAEVIAPGISVAKAPETKAEMTEFKRETLKKATSDAYPDFADDVKALTGGGAGIGNMTADAIDVAFMAASQVISQKRNAMIGSGKAPKKSTKDHKFNDAAAIQHINELNATFYRRQKSLDQQRQ